MGYPNAYPQPYHTPQSAYQTAYQSQQQRLNAMEQQYPPYPQNAPPVYPQQPVQQTPAPQPQSGNASILSVTSEQQAREHPIDLSGTPHLFVMQDESLIFAKRFNLSTGTAEFETYERKTKLSDTAQTVPDNSLLLGVVNDFTQKLNAIQEDLQALRKDVQHGNQSGRDSRSAGKAKSADATNHTTGSGNGTGGE